MSDLDISGGAGSLDAELLDMKTYGGRLSAEGNDVLGLAGPIAGEGAEELAEAMLLAPELVAVVAGKIGGAELSVASTGGSLVTVGTLVGAAVDGYQAVDGLGKELFSEGQIAVGYLAGGVGLPLALTTGVGGAAALAHNPVLAAGLVEYARTVKLTDALQEYLYEHPDQMETLIGEAPGLVQGGLTDVSLLTGPAGPLMLSALSGGHWPSTDYESAVAGLNTIAGHTGRLQDSGDFDLGAPVNRRNVDIGGVRDLMDLQSHLDDKVPAGEGQVRVAHVTGADGKPALVVQVPGTEDWSPTRTTDPVDLTTNTQAMAGADTVMKRKVAEAIRRAQATLPPGTPVMLTGHSQGGIVAATLASDPKLVKELHITSLVTAGSPIARMHVSPDVSVLSLEHTQDAVPMLDGARNPATANWVTVRRELPPDGGGKGPTLGAAHDLRKNYVDTAGEIDVSTDPSLLEWRRRNSAFMGRGTAETYPLVPKK